MYGYTFQIDSVIKKLCNFRYTWNSPFDTHNTHAKRSNCSLRAFKDVRVCVERVPAFIWQYRVPSEMPLLAESVLQGREKGHSEIVSANVTKICVIEG